MKGIVIFSLTLLLLSSCQKNLWKLQSPDGNVTIEVKQEQIGDVSSLIYTVLLKGEKVILDSPLGLSTQKSGDNDFTNLIFQQQQKQQINESYKMPVGKKSLIQHQGNELVLSFTNEMNVNLQLHMRAYDEGVAYRYQVEGQKSIEVNQELSTFQIPKNSIAWIQDYSSAYELHYLKRTLANTETLFPLTSSQAYYKDIYTKALKGKKQDYAFPILLNTPTNKWLYITEAATYGEYAGGRLRSDEGDATSLNLVLGSKVHSDKTLLATPWRVIMVSDKLKTIVESDMINNLNPPCKLEDTGWIEPGTSTFPWLTDHEVNARPERLMEFVDMAAEMGWKWIEFDNAIAFGEDTGGRTEFGKWMSIPWIPDFVAYANSKGIKVAGWDAWKNLNTPEKRDRILNYFTKHGFSGIKVDFLNSDAQERFRFRDDIIKACAERKLMVSFHGATLPRGQQRTWPHIATWEGVLGEESYTYERGQPTPQHNVNLCFTRNIAGSVDFTPTSFELEGTEGFERTTTDAHQMALAVLFESGWQNIGASPEALDKTKAKDFLKNLPAAWDDIYFIEGHPDTHCVMARRKSNNWYIAGINTEEPRKLSISLDFLKQGVYDVLIYNDNAEGKVITSNKQINTSNGLDITMIKNGGFGVMFSNSDFN
jgi:alpha-glucosidase